MFKIKTILPKKLRLFFITLRIRYSKIKNFLRKCYLLCIRGYFFVRKKYRYVYLYFLLTRTNYRRFKFEILVENIVFIRKFYLLYMKNKLLFIIEVWLIIRSFFKKLKNKLPQPVVRALSITYHIFFTVYGDVSAKASWYGYYIWIYVRWHYKKYKNTPPLESNTAARFYADMRMYRKIIILLIIRPTPYRIYIFTKWLWIKFISSIRSAINIVYLQYWDHPHARFLIGFNLTILIILKILQEWNFPFSCPVSDAIYGRVLRRAKIYYQSLPDTPEMQDLIYFLEFERQYRLQPPKKKNVSGGTRADRLRKLEVKWARIEYRENNLFKELIIERSLNTVWKGRNSKRIAAFISWKRVKRQWDAVKEKTITHND